MTRHGCDWHLGVLLPGAIIWLNKKFPFFGEHVRLKHVMTPPCRLTHLARALAFRAAFIFRTLIKLSWIAGCLTP